MKQNLYQLPFNWEWRALGEVATLINGRAYKKHELLDEGPTPVLRVGNFFSNRGWYYSNLKLSEDKYCQKGDLLYAWSASFGPKIWDGEKVIFHYHIWKILTSESIDKLYLFYLLAQDSEDIKSAGNGIAMMHATKGGMEKRLIPLPPMAEQKQIAAILDVADRLRQKDQQLVEHYTALSQSLFLEMFGDLSEYSNRPLKEVSDFIDYRGKTPIKTPSGIPLITAKNVKNGYISTEPEEFISENDYLGWMRRGFPNEGDVLFTTEAPLGQAALMPKYQKVALAQRVICLQPHSELNSSFLMHVIFSSFFKNQLFNFATGSTVKGVRSKELAKIKIPLPSINLQNQFAERIAIIEKQKQQAQANLQKSEALFNSLLQRAFTGELTADKAA